MKRVDVAFVRLPLGIEFPDSSPWIFVFADEEGRAVRVAREGDGITTAIWLRSGADLGVDV